jgi:oleate hydratase
MEVQKMTKAYFVGGGIASLAGAVFLIRDGNMPGKSITILEESNPEANPVGGSIDGQGDADKGFVVRGGRMLNDETYECMWELLKFIPSLKDPKKSVREEIAEFNAKVKPYSHARLVNKNGEIVDVTSLGFSERDRLDLIKMMAQSEESLGTRRIEECYAPGFFKTNFWYMWCTIFAFQSWHSAVELKRYLLRFIHELPRIHTMEGVRRTPYNQYDSMILPILEWLKSQGVNFELKCEVTDLGFTQDQKKITVERISYRKDSQEKEIFLNDGDLVFVTNGSMTAGSSLGSMTSAPVLNNKEVGGSWKLWEKLARENPEFGRPAPFDDHVDQSKWESFTVTLKEPTFFNLMEKFSGNKPGTGGLITFKDSNWLMSIVLAFQPHFLNQPENVQVFWGYGLFPDKKGNYVEKKMSECTGEEILIELCSHLRFNADLQKILQTSNCIPCMMPFITSQFMPRKGTDRPKVVPKGSTNLAFIGQYCEIPDDVVFTVEYSVRAAQIAVYTLLGIDKEIPAIYKGQHDIKVIFNSFLTMHR